MFDFSNTNQLIAQIIGFVALIIIVIGMQQRSYGRIVFCKITNSFLSVIHYLFLAAYTGALINLASCFSNGVYWYRNTKGKSILPFQILFAIMFLTLYVIKIGSVVSLLFVTIVAIVQLFRECMDGNWIAIVLMLFIIVLDIYAHRKNLERLVENKENPADLHEGIKKDIQKLKKNKSSDNIADDQNVVLETSNDNIKDVDVDKKKES
jgi:membrane protein implicated in regulation of membrane protease activity